jgi:hypothetical protein
MTVKSLSPMARHCIVTRFLASPKSETLNQLAKEYDRHRKTIVRVLEDEGMDPGIHRRPNQKPRQKKRTAQYDLGAIQGAAAGSDVSLERMRANMAEIQTPAERAQFNRDLDQLVEGLIKEHGARPEGHMPAGNLADTIPAELLGEPGTRPSTRWNWLTRILGKVGIVRRPSQLIQ